MVALSPLSAKAKGRAYISPLSSYNEVPSSPTKLSCNHPGVRDLLHCGVSGGHTESNRDTAGQCCGVVFQIFLFYYVQADYDNSRTNLIVHTCYNVLRHITRSRTQRFRGYACSTLQHNARCPNVHSNLKCLLGSFQGSTLSPALGIVRLLYFLTLVSVKQ